MIKIVVSVISDLVTDQRVHRVCQTLHENGYEVLLIGTRKKNSLALSSRDYSTRRISMLFQKGFLFYAEWNLRLLWVLLCVKADILLANDLDTLPPNYLVSKWKRQVLVYDTHEYFTETAELYQRRFVKNIWRTIENYLLPKVTYMYTVNQSVAALYNQRFNKQLVVIRNVPMVRQYTNNTTVTLPALPAGKKILLVQGSGLNENRGLEELVQSMTLLPDEFVLVIAGSGLIINRLKEIAQAQQVNKKVIFTGLLPFEQLHALTQAAFAGFSLDKPLNVNQQVSLPNKIFDYLAASVPVIVSNIKEVAAITEQYAVGIIIPEVSAGQISIAVLKLAGNQQQYEKFKRNTAIAAAQLNWNNERKILEAYFETIITQNNLSLG